MDYFNSSIVPYLFLATFVIVIVYAVIQYRAAKKAQRGHHTSADARVHGDVKTHGQAGNTETR